MGKSAPAAPTPPDPTVVSNAQANANIASATAQQKLNMVNQSGPYGTVNYSPDATAPGGYAQTTTLSPAEQALYNQYTGLQSSGLNTASTALDHVNGALSGGLTPPNLQNIAGFDQTASNAAYNQATSRLDPQWQLMQQQQQSRLAAQGLNPNDPSYQNAMGIFNQGRNDAYTSANNQATLTGADLGLQQGAFTNAAANQNFQNQAYAQNQPLNQFGALMSGGQVQGPQANPYVPSQVGQTDVLGAYGLNMAQQNANYQSKLAQQQSGLGGLFNLGSAAITALPFL